MGLFFAALVSYDQGWRNGAPVALGVGLAFGLACELLDIVFEWLQPHAHPTFAKETLLKSGVAHLVVGSDTARGWLYLTDAQLCFRSHSRNSRRHRWKVALPQVRRAEATRTLRILSNGLSIVTDHGTERFLLDDNRRWAAATSTAVDALARPGSEASRT